MKARLLVLVSFCFSVVQAQEWFTTGQNADLMLSGVDFNNTGGPYLYNHPSGIASDGTRFLLCDRFNNRVLVWNSLPIQWNTPPDLVLGQSTFTSNNPGTTKSSLNWPGNVSVGSNGVVVVADTENDRILIWRQFPTQNAQAASVSISLPVLTPPQTMRLEWPWGVWTDGMRVAAVATRGAALLFWNSLPTVDDQQPDYMIRLPQFGTPRNISTDGSTYFFVGDHNAGATGNQPATYFWNSYPTQANQPYNFYRSEWIKGTKLPDGKLVAGGLSNVYVWNTMPTSETQPPNLTVTNGLYKNGDGPDVVYAGGRLYINNYNGNNVHVFNTIPTFSTQIPDFAIGSPLVQVNTLDSIHYIQNPVLATDGVRLIATSDFDATLWIWSSFPQQSGRRPDIKIPLRSFGLAPWDNAIHSGRIVVAGKRSIAIWNSVPLQGEGPSRVFANSIGGVSFQELKGVALDSQYLYVADAQGSIYVWAGLPVTGNESPYKVITAPGSPLNHLHSDGSYLCAVVQSGTPTVYVYRVADIALPGAVQPFKTIASSALLRLNLPAGAITFDGSIAIANTSNNAVYIWRDINDAGDTNRVVVLGQSSLGGRKPAIGINRLFMPASLVAIQDNLWVGEFKFSSRIVKYRKQGVQTVHENDAPKDFRLEQNYPNPFNPMTKLSFVIGHSSLVSLKVFDVLGREVATILNKEMDPGFHQITFDATDLASGVYIYRLSVRTPSGQVGKFVQQRKMMVLR
jgi:hypothetical protein